MRKRFHLFVMVAVLCLQSCSDSFETSESLDDLETNESIDVRTIDEAISIANESLEMIEDSESRSIHRTINRNDIKVVADNRGRGNSDRLLYIVNFEDNAGFAVVAAPRNCEALLAITESGNYDPAVGTDNPGLEMFMVEYEHYAASVKFPIDTVGKVPIDEEVIYKVVHDTIFNEKVSPLLSVNWGQESVYGQDCPNGVSGCVITAAAMCMSYFEYPVSINLTYPSAPMTNISLNWKLMKRHKSVFEYDICSEESHQMISKLCRELGFRFNATYSQEGTGAVLKSTSEALTEIGYTIGNFVDYSPDIVETALMNNKLVLINGRTKDDEDGHAWVVDGFKCLKIHDVEMTKQGLLGDWVINDAGTRVYHYNHFNWGWDGRSNGYFRDGNFNSELPDERDNSLGLGNYEFVNQHIMTITH